MEIPLRFSELTTTQLNSLDRSQTLFFLPVSLMEEHGPHLPLGTDLYIAGHMADRLSRRTLIAGLFRHTVILPALATGAGGIIMAGTVDSQPDTVTQLVLEYGRSLARDGFKYGVVTSGHAGRTHMQALDRACTVLRDHHSFEMLSLGNRVITKFLSGELISAISARMETPFTAEDLRAFEEDGHAGWWETSAMLYFEPNLVRNQYKQLAYSAQVGDQGYKGHPQRGNQEFARAAVEVMLDIAVQMIAEAFARKNTLLQDAT